MWLLFQAPEGVLGCAPQGFTIRRAFNINLRKAFQVTATPTPIHMHMPAGSPLQQQQQLVQHPSRGLSGLAGCWYGLHAGTLAACRANMSMYQGNPTW